MPAAKEPQVFEIPYLAMNGIPFHKLNDGQKRWYTKGVLSTQEQSEIEQYFHMIEERVKHYQSRRSELKKKGNDELKFKEDTPLEERERRTSVVRGYVEEYVAAKETIEKLKGTVLEVTPGALMLPAVD